MTLDHAHPDCTGWWTPRDVPTIADGRMILRRMVMCTGCGTAYPETPDVREAAQQENGAGQAGMRAARAGARELERERKEKER